MFTSCQSGVQVLPIVPTVGQKVLRFEGWLGESLLLWFYGGLVWVLQIRKQTDAVANHSSMCIEASLCVLHYLIDRQRA